MGEATSFSAEDRIALMDVAATGGRTEGPRTAPATWITQPNRPKSPTLATCRAARAAVSYWPLIPAVKHCVARMHNDPPMPPFATLSVEAAVALDTLDLDVPSRVPT